MPTQAELKELAKKHGTPLFVVDHNVLRKNYAEFRRRLPRVQVYYAVKANPDPEIVKTFYKTGAGFDVASMKEFRLVHKNIERLSAKARQDFIWDKIIYANPIKDNQTLKELNTYEPLVTYDNPEEIKKIREYAPKAGLALRICVPNTGSVVELSSKFGAAPSEALALITAAFDAGLTVEGLCFHVGSQCTNFDNFVQALTMSSSILKEARAHGYELTVLDIGDGFSAPDDGNTASFRRLAGVLNSEFKRLFPLDIEILAEPGRFMCATAGTLVVKVIGKAERDGKPCYYLNDGIYHTYSGILFDHCQYSVKAFKRGKKEISAVFGPTCDALDTISQAEPLPTLNLGDLVFSRNIGAYSHASSTCFNGFAPTKVVHINGATK